MKSSLSCCLRTHLLELLVESPGTPQTVPPAVLIGHPRAQAVRVSAAAAQDVVQVKLSLQLHGERSIPALQLDPADVVFVTCVLAHGPTPLYVKVLVWVQVFGLLLPLPAPL